MPRAYYIKNELNEKFVDPRISCDFSIFSLEPFQLLLHVQEDVDELSTEIRYGLSRKIRSQLTQLDARVGGCSRQNGLHHIGTSHFRSIVLRHLTMNFKIPRMRSKLSRGVFLCSSVCKTIDFPCVF